MNLVMFDIDGTLTRTNAVDTQCFVSALSEVLQIRNIDTDWNNYRYATDQGCLEEITRNYKGRPGTDDELMQAKLRHVELLRERADSDPLLFLPVPGANEAIDFLKKQVNVVVALATGAWLESARLKLSRAGLTVDGIPFASSNDSLSREEIMKIAEKRSLQVSNAPFRTRTYVGDAAWDVRAAISLGYHFIGVASEAKAKRLRTEGARWVIPDYEPVGAFCEALNTIWNAEQSHRPGPE